MNKKQIYDDIKKRISSEELTPGQWIIERDICETYGISRTPVREILLTLSSEGLLDFESGKGYKVKDLTSEEIVAIYKARAAVEGYAVRLVCMNKTPEFTAAVKDIYEKLQALDINENLQDVLRLGNQLHNLIIASTENFLLKEFYEKLQNYKILTNNYAKKWISIEAQARGGHLKLIEAILDGDPDNAERAMWNHLQETIRLILSSYINSYADLA